MFAAASVPGSRQGCYKCGNCTLSFGAMVPELTTVGHIAENCQSPSRLCYNCREAGHESPNCPRPRTAEGKQCYACGGVGHVKSDCPSLRGVRGAPQHAQARIFNHHPGPGVPAVTGGVATQPPPRCYQCGRPGHIARMCAARRPPLPLRARANPDGTPVKCYRCNGENHLARDCLAPIDNSAKKCYRCGETGHIARDCPTIEDGEGVVAAATTGEPALDTASTAFANGSGTAAVGTTMAGAGAGASAMGDGIPPAEQGTE